MKIGWCLCLSVKPYYSAIQNEILPFQPCGVQVIYSFPTSVNPSKQENIAVEPISLSFTVTIPLRTLSDGISSHWKSEKQQPIVYSYYQQTNKRRYHLCSILQETYVGWILLLYDFNLWFDLWFVIVEKISITIPKRKRQVIHLIWLTSFNC